MNSDRRSAASFSFVSAGARWRAWLPLAAVAVALCLPAGAPAEEWSRFRGPNGAGQSEAASIPNVWQESNYLWKRPLDGIGHSSPVVWGDRVFVTSADPSTGEQRLAAVDAHSGAPLWQRRFNGSSYSIHAFNSFASSTPALDAECVYYMWLADGMVKLVALTHAGEDVWSSDVGPFEEKHGFGVSPIVVDDLVYVINDNEGASTLTAFDRRSGEVRWREPRPSGTTAFATPCLLELGAGGSKLLVTASTSAGLAAFDAGTGEMAWQGLDDQFPQRVVASPVVAAGLIFVMCGQGGNGLHLIAARPGSGATAPQEVYRLRSGIPNVPTPIAAGELVFLWHDRGTVTCLDAATGEAHWRERVGGDYHSSPIRLGDRILNTSVGGEAIFLAASKDFEILARNQLGESTRATPAVAHGRLYVRTESSLICIGTPQD